MNMEEGALWGRIRDNLDKLRDEDFFTTQDLERFLLISRAGDTPDIQQKWQFYRTEVTKELQRRRDVLELDKKDAISQTNAVIQTVRHVESIGAQNRNTKWLIVFGVLTVIAAFLSTKCSQQVAIPSSSHEESKLPTGDDLKPKTMPAQQATTSQPEADSVIPQTKP